jgi:hypothetical protein
VVSTCSEVPATLTVATTTAGDTAGLGDVAADGEPELPQADRSTAVRATRGTVDARFARTTPTGIPRSKVFFRGQEVCPGVLRHPLQGRPSGFEPRASRSCPVRPRARRPVTFEPGTSRSCTLHLSVKLRAAIDCCRASSDRPATVTTAPLGRDSSPGNCDPAVIRRLPTTDRIADFEYGNGRGRGI